jgi:hypothetical protein
MADTLFTQPSMYWVGMHTDPACSADELAAFNDFYSHVHVPEVLAANPGFVRGTRFELLEPDPRNQLGPRWLVMYEMDGEDAARAYAARNDGPPEGRPRYSPGPAAWQSSQTTWRMIWRRLTSHGTPAGLPDAIYMVGMNVPPNTTADELAAFNAFYTGTHVPEVVAMDGYTTGTRFELERAFRHPEPPGCPRYVAIYEADEAAVTANKRRKLNPNPGPSPLSSGPPAWEGHDTLWRLLYRRIED